MVNFKKKIKKYLPNVFNLAKTLLKREEYYGYQGLDRRVIKYLRKDRGFFVDIGAHDGISFNNTFWLEKNRGWQGILIEPMPDLFRQCRANRPGTLTFNCACVAKDYAKDTIEMIYADFMSVVSGHRQDQIDFLNKAKQYCNQQYKIMVQAKTLTAILSESGVKQVDFLSIDVEGYELNVLKGLDFKILRPEYVLIETDKKDLIDQYLSSYYYLGVKLSQHDYLYKLK